MSTLTVCCEVQSRVRGFFGASYPGIRPDDSALVGIVFPKSIFGHVLLIKTGTGLAWYAWRCVSSALCSSLCAQSKRCKTLARGRRLSRLLWISTRLGATSRATAASVLRCAVGNSSVLAARLTAPGSGDPGPAKARSVTREPQGARSREGAQRGPREPATRTPATNNKNGLARRAQRAPRQDERLGQG